MFDAYARRDAGHAAELLRGHIQRAGDFLVRCLS
jgi:DNA-binding GntR family transcriptional regulator